MDKESNASNHSWGKFNSMVHVLRAEMSTNQFKELKSLAAISGKTLQKFVGDLLKKAIRNHKQKGESQ